MQNIYKGTMKQPYHLSVGAVLVNESNEVCCHYFDHFEYKPDNQSGDDFFVLMRETVENG